VAQGVRVGGEGARGWPWWQGCLGRSVVVGFGSDLSEEPAFQDVEPVTLDCRVVPGCPPGPASQRAVMSTWSWRQTASLMRRFNARSASFFVLPRIHRSGRVWGRFRGCVVALE
jgi:hypothetical protein